MCADAGTGKRFSSQANIFHIALGRRQFRFDAVFRVSETDKWCLQQHDWDLVDGNRLCSANETCFVSCVSRARYLLGRTEDPTRLCNVNTPALSSSRLDFQTPSQTETNVATSTAVRRCRPKSDLILNIRLGLGPTTPPSHFHTHSSAHFATILISAHVKRAMKIIFALSNRMISCRLCEAHRCGARLDIDSKWQCQYCKMEQNRRCLAMKKPYQRSAL